MATHEPEIGQLIFGNPAGEHAISAIGKATFFEALRVLQRTYWNVHQSEWEDYTRGEFGAVSWRGYYWGDNEAEAAMPNFVAFGLELRRYKHPGRSMSVNRDMSPDQWAEWLEKVVAELERVEHEATPDEERVR